MGRDLSGTCHPFDRLAMEADVVSGFSGIERQLVPQLLGTPALDKSREITRRWRGLGGRWLIDFSVLDHGFSYEEAGVARHS